MPFALCELPARTSPARTVRTAVLEARSGLGRDRAGGYCTRQAGTGGKLPRVGAAGEKPSHTEFGLQVSIMISAARGAQLRLITSRSWSGDSGQVVPGLASGGVAIVALPRETGEISGNQRRWR